MERWHSGRFVAGMATIPLSGALGLAALLLRGPLALPLQSNTEWVETVSSNAYLTLQNLLVASYVLPFFGFITLYAYLARDTRHERMSFIGLIAALWGTALALPALGIVSYVGSLGSESGVASQTTVGHLVAEAVVGPGLAVGIVAAILYTTGPLLLGIAIWRREGLPKLAAVMFAAHGILMSVGFTSFPALVLGWVLLVISGTWLTLSMKNEPRP